MRYSRENKFRMVNINYDFRDRGAEPGGENVARNITSVATAATDESK